MSFMEHLGDAWDSVKDAGESALGMADNVAKLLIQNELDQYHGDYGPGSARMKAQDQRKADFMADFSQRAGAYRAEHKTTAGMQDTLGSKSKMLAVKTGAVLQYPVDKVTRGVSTYMILTSGTLGNETGLAGLASDKWGEAWDKSDDVTATQATVRGFVSAGDPGPSQGKLAHAVGIEGSTWANIAQYGESGNDKFSPQFSLMTGIGDAALAWYADPLVLGSKGARFLGDSRNLMQAGDLASAEHALATTERSTLKRRLDSLDQEIEKKVYPFGRPTEAEPTEEMVTVYRGNGGPVDPNKIGKKGIRVTTEKDYAIEHGGSDHLYEMQIPKSALPNTTFSDALDTGPLPHAFLTKEQFLAAKPKLISGADEHGVEELTKTKDEIQRVLDGPDSIQPRHAKVHAEIRDYVADSVGKPFHELVKYKSFKDSNQGAAMAAIFSELPNDAEGRQLGELFKLSAMGSVAAKEALVQKNAELGFKLDEMTKTLDGYTLPPRQIWDMNGNLVGLAENPAHSEEAAKALKLRIESDTKTFDMYNRALGDMKAQREAAESAGVFLEKDQTGIFLSDMRMRGTARAHASTRVDRMRADYGSAYVIQNGITGIPMRIARAPITRRPHQGLDVSDAEGAVQEIDRMTQQARGLDPAVRMSLIDSVGKAPDDAARTFAVQHANRKIAQHIGEQMGYTKAEIDHLMTIRETQTKHAIRGFQENNFGFASDGSVVINPLTETQLQNWVSTLDVPTLYKTLKRNKDAVAALREARAAGDDVSGLGLSTGTNVFDVAEDFLDQFNDLWKLEVLFRGGYPIRNGIDGQLRILSLLGARETLGQHRETIQTGHAIRSTQRELAGGKRLTPIVKHKERVARRDEFRETAQDAVVADRETEMLGPYALRHPEGETGDQVRFTAKMTGADTTEAFAAMASTHYEGTLNKLRGAGPYVTRHADDPRYEGDFLDVVNNHFRQSYVTKRLLKGDDPAQIIRDLKKSDHRDLRRRLVHGDDTVEGLVQRNVENMNHFLTPAGGKADPALWKVFDERPAQRADIPRIHGEIRDNWPKVNAAQVADEMGRGEFAKALDDFRTWFFKNMNAAPDNIWARHPTYRALQRGKMRQELRRLDPELQGTLTEAEQRVLHEQATIFARRQMKRFMFDASNQSNLGHFLRFTSPFYTAWEDVMLKYGRLLMNDPSLLPHAWQVWSSPNDASVVEVVDSLTGGKVSGASAAVKNTESVALPAKFLQKYFGVGGTRISKGGFNVVLQGDPWWLPGAGPLAQAATQDLVVGLQSDDMADWAQKTGILPFGLQDKGKLGWKYVLSSSMGPASMNDAQVGRLKVMVLQAEEFKYRKALEKWQARPVGERPKPPTPEEVNRKVMNLRLLRTATALTSPASIQYVSEYQFYIDQWHAFSNDIGPGGRFKDTQAAEAAFHDKYGDDLYLFTMSQSQNLAGVAPTKRADAAARKIGDLIGEYPEFGGFLVGPDNTGTYNKNVYALQTMRQLGSSNSKWRDTYDDPFDALKKNNAEQGWIEYTKMTDRLQGILEQRKLPSMAVKGAEDLRAFKRQWIETVGGEGGPAWGKDWRNDLRDEDGSRLLRFLQMAQTATKDKRFAHRKDIATMGMYLAGREKIRAIMAKRGAVSLPQIREDGTFGDSANADLAQVWAAFTQSLVAQDVTFSQVYERYLDRDTLQDGP